MLAIGAGGRLVAVDAVSARIEELAGLPAVDLAGARELQPDLVLVGEPADPRSPAVAALVDRGVRVVEFAPHDLEDVLALVREVGRELVGAEQASRFEAAFSRPLAKIGGDSHGQPRPRVIAVVSLDPLVIAGGHSFETDLIEIAGGRSVTHRGEEPRLPIDADRWEELAPDLVMSSRNAQRRRKAKRLCATRCRLAPRSNPSRSIQPSGSDASVEPAERLRALIEPLSRRRMRRSGG